MECGAETVGLVAGFVASVRASESDAGEAAALALKLRCDKANMVFLRLGPARDPKVKPLRCASLRGGRGVVEDRLS